MIRVENEGAGVKLGMAGKVGDLLFETSLVLANVLARIPEEKREEVLEEMKTVVLTMANERDDGAVTTIDASLLNSALEDFNGGDTDE